MVNRPKSSVRRQRPARIRVPNRERVLFTIRDHRFVGILQRVSLTGGSVIHTEEPFQRGTLAKLDLITAFGKVTAQIEFLQIGADGNAAAQAFRLLAMDDGCSGRLRAAIEQMQAAGCSDAEIRQKGLVRLVSEGLSTTCDHIQRVFQTGSLGRKARTRPT